MDLKHIEIISEEDFNCWSELVDDKLIIHVSKKTTVSLPDSRGIGREFCGDGTEGLPANDSF